MNLEPTPEQIQIVDAVADFLARKLPLSRYQTQTESDSQITDEQWREIVDLGWIGLGLDEQHGGLGSSIVEEMLLFREIGRHVGPVDILGSVIGARLAALAYRNASRDAILEGRARVAVAIPSGKLSRNDGRINGPVLLFGSSSAEYAVLTDANTASLIATASLSLEPLPCLEAHLPLARAMLASQASEAQLDARVDPLGARQTLLASSMQVGVAEATLDMAVAYAKQRQQFGQPIGSFQAIKHLCADMAVRCEEARAQVFYASLCQSGSPRREFEREVAAAAFISTRAGIENAAANIQVHGGIGMTAELNAHWYLKRAHVLDQLMGNARTKLDLLVHDG